MPTPAGTIQHLLVIADPDAITPYDPASTALPGDEHFYWSSVRRADHPWIAQVGEGSGALPDISIGGQRLEMPLGNAIDGECQVRVIDRPGPVLACGANVLIDEDGTAGLDNNYLTTGGWTLTENETGSTSITWGNTASDPLFSGHILFASGTYSGYIEKTFDGTENGGAHFTPFQVVGMHARVNWTLDTGPGNIFIEFEGADGPVRVSGLTSLFSFWTIPPDPGNNQVDDVVYVRADANGEVIVRLGGENYGGSCNVSCTFSDIQIVSCAYMESTDLTALYTTNALADDDARQRLLGWPYFLKESTDGGATWTAVMYAGYVKAITMEQSLTFLLVGGDSGRGRRIGSAWRGLNPLADFIP